jgi:hypothetical protein
VKTTIELPDPLLREAKAAAASSGLSLKELFAEALSKHLATRAQPAVEVGQEAWRELFGSVPHEAVAEIDAIIEAEFERIDPDDWR